MLNAVPIRVRQIQNRILERLRFERRIVRVGNDAGDRERLGRGGQFDGERQRSRPAHRETVVLEPKDRLARILRQQ